MRGAAARAAMVGPAEWEGKQFLSMEAIYEM
jgi:hypothetical protein